MKIDLNCDLGESFGNYKIGMDEEVIKYISSANIACGFHASDPLVMEKTVMLAKENGVQVGAHPGFPDLAGFGRRNMNVSTAELKTMVMYQVGALAAFCKAKGVKMNHVKPHGAMYNMAAKDIKLALAIAEGIAEVDDLLILLGLSGSQLLKAGRETGLKCAAEVIKRVIKMIKLGKVQTITGKEIEIKPDSICVHGDNPKALNFVKLIRERLIGENIKIEAM